MSKPSSPSSSDQLAANAVLLSPRQWGIAILCIALIIAVLPGLWERAQGLKFKTDYRIPYSLGNDYWLYSRYARNACAEEEATLVLGDSVVWGHYVSRDETLSHYLNEESDGHRFYNLGIDGIHPAALAGLIQYHGSAITGRRVLVNGNLLWMADTRRDLTATKEFSFNHPHLVPQFHPRIPCYSEPLAGRIAIAIERIPVFAAWIQHVRLTSFNGQSVHAWTVDNPYENPIQALRLKLPSPDEPLVPPPDARSWTARDLRPVNFPWVRLDKSLQWAMFTRAIEILRERGNTIFVLVGPFNEHMLVPESREKYLALKRDVAIWLRERGIPHAVPEALARERYADASHPLPAGYAVLAEHLL